MANMAFGVQCVRDFLAKHGHVLTVRGYDYKTDTATVRDLDGVMIKRTKVCEIFTEKDLVGFVPLSSFATAAAWMRQIQRFVTGRMWLYRVEIDDEQLSKQEQEYEEREHQREFNRQNAWSNEEEIADILSHPLDIRSDPAMRDPALVDLTASKAQAHRDRLDADARATECKRERLRAMYGEQTHAAPQQEPHDSEKIMGLSNAELVLKTLCGE